MNISQVFVVRANGDVEHLWDAKVPNGPSFLVWKSLSEKYSLGFDPVTKSTGGVEKLAYNAEIPLFERIALICTFEGLWIRRQNMATVINALEDFASLDVKEDCRYALQHLTAVMRLAFLLPDCAGVAFNLTGSATPFWHVYEKLPDTETEDATLRKFNVLKDSGHFEIMDELALKVTSERQ